MYGAGRFSTTQRVSKRVMGQVVFLQHKEYRRGVWGRDSFYYTKSIEEGYGAGRLSTTQRVSKRGMGQVIFPQHKEYLREVGQVVFLQHKEYRRGVWARSSFYNTKSIEEGYREGRLSAIQRVSKRVMGQVVSSFLGWHST